MGLGGSRSFGGFWVKDLGLAAAGAAAAVVLLVKVYLQ